MSSHSNPRRSPPPPGGSSSALNAPPSPPPPPDGTSVSLDERRLHAHIECSQGVSTYCILEATLGIARELGAQNRWIDELEDIMPRIFPGMLKNCYLRDSGSGGGKVSASKVDFIPRKISVYLDALNSADQNLLLSSWVRENAKAVLRELIDPNRPSKADPVSFSVGHIVAALWCFDRLRVRSFTCSPVPWSSKPTASLSPTRLLRQSLFVGLPTQFDAESYTKRTTGDGLALLRVLTGVARDPTLPISRDPPALIFRATGTGSDDGSADDIIQIGLTMGELLPPSLSSSSTATPISAALTALRTNVPAKADMVNNWEVSHDFKEIQANIDDMTPEHLAFAMDQLLQQGAADVWIVPILMKKGRAAHCLHCLCAEQLLDELLALIFRHTTTLGVRVVHSLQRMALRRQIISVQLPSTFSPAAVDGLSSSSSFSEENDATTDANMVDVKVGYLGDQVVSIKPEFDHCYRIATKTGEPIQSIASAAVRKAEQIFARSKSSMTTNSNKSSSSYQIFPSSSLEKRIQRLQIIIINTNNNKEQ